MAERAEVAGDFLLRPAQLRDVCDFGGRVRGGSWSKDEKRILSWSEDGTVQVWDVDGKQALIAYKHPGWVWGASWSKDEKRILSWSIRTARCRSGT